MIERDKWMYVWADSPEAARRFFGMPLHVEVHLHEINGDHKCWAVQSSFGLEKQMTTIAQYLGSAELEVLVNRADLRRWLLQIELAENLAETIGESLKQIRGEGDEPRRTNKIAHDTLQSTSRMLPT